MCSKLYFLLILAWIMQSVLTFNMDTSSPTVVFPEIPSVANREEFGFSITQHEMPNNEKMLLIGAPKADYNGLLEGGVYSCQFQNGSHCKRIEAFNLRNDSTGFSPIESQLASAISTQFNGQLMGFTVHSSHGRVLACAPLFIYGVTTHFIPHLIDVGITNGRCIMFPQNLNHSDLKHISDFDVPGFQLAGTDAVLFNQKTDSPITTNIAIGSVYKGNSRPRSGGVFSVNADQIFNSISTVDPTSISYSQFRGYRVQSGHFAVSISQNLEEIVSSAPRDNQHKGVIRVLRPDSFSTVLQVVWTISGTDYDGYFGYDFSMLDLKTGGYHSIAVGCPFCNRGRGRVTVYLHSGDPNNPVREIIQIESPSQNTGQFGYSVESLGDINRDGYDDVAISAPYANDGGIVYIYTGGRDGLVYSQAISAPLGTSGFGTALTAGIDIDDNGYPDLSIADLSGAEIVTIRSSPVVNVQQHLLEVLRINYAEKNCRIGDLELTCFNITPCFNFTTVFGAVAKFAIEYTLVVDGTQQRVGLINQPLMNQVTNEVTINGSEEWTCSSTHRFFLHPDFSSTDPIPVELTARDVDNLLSLQSNDTDRLGGPLHPVLNRLDEFGSPTTTSLRQFIIPEFVVNCGNDSICNPVYEIAVTLNGNKSVVPLAAAYEFSFTVTLNITEEDSLAAFLIVTMPSGIQFTNSESITNLALSNCESLVSNTIRCNLKNPITAGETVKLRLSFRPNVRVIKFDIQHLIFNFAVKVTNNNTLSETSLSVPTSSIASYDIASSFGSESVQANRILPTLLNVTSLPRLTTFGPTLIYQVTVYNSQRNDRGSPIPRTQLTITWPSTITLSGSRQPLLVPTNLVVVGSNSTTCRQRNAIPYNLLSVVQQPTFLPNLTESVPMGICRGHNITCGIIQCTIENMQAQPSDNTTVTTPVQISIFATLWSFSIRDPFNISVFSNISSSTEYPVISDNSISETAAYIYVLPAVREIMVECLEPWVIAVSVVAGLLIVIIFLLCFGLFGCIGHGHFKRIKEEEIRKRWRELQEIDGSLGSRVIPPPESFRESKIEIEEEDKDKEFEAELDAELSAYEQQQQQQHTSDLGPITDTQAYEGMIEVPITGSQTLSYSDQLKDDVLDGQIQDELECFSAQLGISEFETEI